MLSGSAAQRDGEVEKKRGRRRFKSAGYGSSAASHYGMAMLRGGLGGRGVLSVISEKNFKRRAGAERRNVTAKERRNAGVGDARVLATAVRPRRPMGWRFRVAALEGEEFFRL